ncbi:MAG: amidohydrolase family protein [Acidimicrobiales bacterium]|nr:amidohydrolase family protein [Acidimicrobiales bacterium]
MKGACDTHVHFYNSSYPVAPTATLLPPNASVDDYLAVQAALGLDRVVIVQPTTYGTDNRCQLEAAARLGESARAIVVIDNSVSDQELKAMSEIGVIGARFHMLPGGAVDWDQLDLVASRIAPFGWHVQLQMNGHALGKRRDQLLRLPCPLVVDHVGRFMPPASPSSPAFQVLLDLVDAGAHVKLSAPYESATDADHRYPEVSECIETLVKRAGDRLLWASNWPHPGQTDPPSHADLERLRNSWLPDERVRTQVLVTNPSVLYNF